MSQKSYPYKDILEQAHVAIKEDDLPFLFETAVVATRQLNNNLNIAERILDIAEYLEWRLPRNEIINKYDVPALFAAVCNHSSVKSKDQARALDGFVRTTHEIRNPGYFAKKAIEANRKSPLEGFCIKSFINSAFLPEHNAIRAGIFKKYILEKPQSLLAEKAIPYFIESAKEKDVFWAIETLKSAAIELHKTNPDGKAEYAILNALSKTVSELDKKGQQDDVVCALKNIVTDTNNADGTPVVKWATEELVRRGELPRKSKIKNARAARAFKGVFCDCRL